MCILRPRFGDFRTICISDQRLRRGGAPNARWRALSTHASRVRQNAVGFDQNSQLLLRTDMARLLVIAGLLAAIACVHGQAPAVPLPADPVGACTKALLQEVTGSQSSCVETISKGQPAGRHQQLRMARAFLHHRPVKYLLPVEQHTVVRHKFVPLPATEGLVSGCCCAAPDCCRVLQAAYGPDSTAPSRNCFCVPDYWKAVNASQTAGNIKFTSYLQSCRQVAHSCTPAAAARQA